MEKYGAVSKTGSSKLDGTDQSRGVFWSRTGWHVVKQNMKHLSCVSQESSKPWFVFKCRILSSKTNILPKLFLSWFLQAAPWQEKTSVSWSQVEPGMLDLRHPGGISQWIRFFGPFPNEKCPKKGNRSTGFFLQKWRKGFAMDYGWQWNSPSILSYFIRDWFPITPNQLQSLTFECLGIYWEWTDINRCLLRWILIWWYIR